MFFQLHSGKSNPDPALKFRAGPEHDGLEHKELRRESSRDLGLKLGLHSILWVRGDLWRTELARLAAVGLRRNVRPPLSLLRQQPAQV